MKIHLLIAVLLVSTSFPICSLAADATRQTEVAKHGAEVMPFQLKATRHLFTKTSDGGVQVVVVKDMSDALQIRLVRAHLQDIQRQFLKRDFSGPAYIHGANMPGLAALSAASPGQVSIVYTDVQGGGELHYRTQSEPLVHALHAWFDTQLSDHGSDAMTDHHNHHGSMHGH